VRLGLAEDAGKVQRIAVGSAAHLRRLYRGAAQRAAAWRAAPASSGAAWTQNSDEASRAELVTRLPPGLLRRLGAAAGLRAAAAAPAEAVARAVAAAGAHEAQLRAALSATVRASSRRQALAGLLSAGLGSAARYVGAKMRKAVLSRYAQFRPA